MNNDTTGTDDKIDATDQRTAVRERYSTEATEGSCCSESEPAETVGLGLGCGNPTGIASLDTGDDVVDLGCGAGFDCFVASQQVGESGRVIGVDMTPEMVEKARENADQNKLKNVEFRLGEMEYLPLANESVDVVLSNCAINLSTNKPQVFREAYRVLRPKGRLAVADNVRRQKLPSELQTDLEAVAACVADAAGIKTLETLMTDAGFTDATVTIREDRESEDRNDAVDWNVTDYVVSADIEAIKPNG